jgi:AbrB family looped-hinge helix DNA binding protein
MEEYMPHTRLTSKGQITIPKEVRRALRLKPSEIIIVVVEGDHAIIKPLRGTILDIGGSIEIPEREKPTDFRRVRDGVKKKISEGAGKE